MRIQMQVYQVVISFKDISQTLKKLFLRPVVLFLINIEIDRTKKTSSKYLLLIATLLAVYSPTEKACETFSIYHHNHNPCEVTR